MAITERQVAALFDMLFSLALLVLMGIALLRFFQAFDRPELGLGRYLFLPAGLGLGVAYALWRGWRAYRRLRDGAPQ